MALTKICGVNIRIDRDPSAKLYYMYIQYRRNKELPIMLGKYIDPRRVDKLAEAFFEKERIKCRPRFVEDRIASLLQNTFKEMGIEDEKTVDFKLFKWKRISHR